MTTPTSWGFTLRRLIWIDAFAALLSGMNIFFLSTWLSKISFLPSWVFQLQVGLSFLYAFYSFILAFQTVKPKLWVQILICANFSYSIFCLCLLFYFFQTTNGVGLFFFLAESIFVAILARMEKRALKSETSTS